MKLKPLNPILALVLGLALAGVTHAQSEKKPNILIIWGDDVGMYNISAYHRGLMGGSTPNIDRLAKQGMSTKDPTLASLLKPLGYATGQFGKNHLGDRDEHLPTNNGFDEFMGILYHLNAGEYEEQYDFPKDPAMAKKFAQRGVIHSWAQPDGKQKIEDKGPFGQERQRSIEQEILKESKRFITEATNAGKPFFVWHSTTRMHYRTNLSKEYEGKSGYGL